MGAANTAESAGRVVRNRLAAEDGIPAGHRLARHPAHAGPTPLGDADRSALPRRGVLVGRKGRFARRHDCPRRRLHPEQAAEAYRRWLDKSLDAQSGRLEIVGVGTLIQKSFRPDPAFDRLLNPQGRDIRIRRRTTPWWLWSLSTLGIVFLAAAGIFWLDPVTRWPEWFSSTPTSSRCGC